MEKEIKEYTKRCINGLGKTILSATINNIARVNKMYCNNQQKRQELMDAAHCGNENRNGTIQCNNELVHGIQSGKGVQTDLKLPIVCW